MCHVMQLILPSTASFAYATSPTAMPRHIEFENNSGLCSKVINLTQTVDLKARLAQRQTWKSKKVRTTKARASVHICDIKPQAHAQIHTEYTYIRQIIRRTNPDRQIETGSTLEDFVHSSST